MSLNRKEDKVFETILYPTDCSEVSLKALNYVKNLHGAGCRKVILLRVIDEKHVEALRRGMRFAGKDTAAFLAQICESLQEEARHQVAPMAAELEAAGLNVKVRIESGKPRSRILEIADEEGVSAIILGSHGRGNVAGMLLGSVADYVVRHARQPVIVIKR